MPDKTYPQLPGESNSAYGTRLTAISLGNSPAARVPLNLPANWQTAPLSPDLEDRTSTPNNTSPPLLDRINARLAQIQQQLLMTKSALTPGNNWNPYADQNAQDAAVLASAQQMYHPGQGAASLTPQQAALIRAQANQRFMSNGR